MIKAYVISKKRGIYWCVQIWQVLLFLIGKTKQTIRLSAIEGPAIRLSDVEGPVIR